jgi:4-hydroxybenzoyl-CoA thioesterase
MIFKKQKLIRFHHCDPAGIVFYPQYLMLCNEMVEDWLAEAHGIGLEVLIREHKRGIPMRHLEAEFLLPSMQGERLEFQLKVERLGGSSIKLRIDALSGTELRFFSRQTMVWSNVEGPKATRIDPDWRKRFELYLDTGTENGEKS